MCVKIKALKQRLIEVGLKIWSAGSCGVCFSTGTQALFISNSGKFLYVCPMCEVAWLTPQLPNRLDSINSVDELAPTGIRLPSVEDVSAVIEGGVHLEYVTEDFFEDVMYLLGDS